MVAQTSVHDLVVVALPGVQRLIGEARSTADVRAGSEIVAHLAGVAARHIGELGGELVIPSSVDEVDGMPNRIVALAPSGFGVPIVEKAVAAVRDEWAALVHKVFEPGELAATPGMPNVQWVCVPDEGRGYGWQWARAQALLTARRRVRDFQPQEWSGRAICALSTRWPAEDVSPPNLKEHEQATLSATNWVKRRWQHLKGGDRFPSTLSIASAPFRRQVLMVAAEEDEVKAAIAALRGAVSAVGGSGESRVAGLPVGSDQDTRWFSRSGGPWVYLERWQPRTLARDTGRDVEELREVADNGRKALDRFLKATDECGVRRPTDYLAILVQDLDGMGAFLSGDGVNAANGTIAVEPEAHRDVSALLGQLAVGQREELRGGELLGVPVYVGGDDLLAFTPASTALTAAQACHDLIGPQLPTASTAVLFFHYQAGLQAALSRARELLHTAKESIPGKNALAVGYLRRSGVRECSIRPWWGMNRQSSAAMFQVFGRETAHPLSPRLVADIERDATELAGLRRRDQSLYRAELTRLVQRHLGGEKKGHVEAASEAVSALLELGAGESPAGVARVGVFLRQEAC